MLARFLQPDFETFQARAAQGNLVPVWMDLAADYETPLSAFQRIHDGRHGFLLESAELTQHSGRYSLLGSEPPESFMNRPLDLERAGGREYQGAFNPVLGTRERLAGRLGFLGHDRPSV